MAYPTITALPTPPSRQRPSDFATEADAFLGAFPTLRTEVNTAGEFVETKAEEAETSAQNAATSETNAATSETNAANSASAAAEDAAEIDSFAELFLGSKASDPSVDNDGDPLQTGAIYYNTTGSQLKVYDGSDWQNAVFNVDATGALITTNNLSDLDNADAAIQNLGITATTTELNYVDGVTSPIQTQIDNITVTNATLTKSFVSGETSTIALSQAITAGAPVVSVTKEVPQTSVTSNSWDVATNGSNYDRHDTAYTTTLTPSNSTGDGTFTLGVGSFAADDVGKTIEGNGGEAILTATDGSYSLVTAFNDTTSIASGDWSMYAAVFDATNGLELSLGLGDGFDIDNTIYDSVSFSVSGQDTGPLGIVFNNDGTKMYIIGEANASVFQYSLSVAFDLSTASYDNISFSFAETGDGGDTDDPVAIAFNDDGTKMYIIGDSFVVAPGSNVEAVAQYSLLFPFDIRTASYDNVYLAIDNQEPQPRGLTFKDDGTKMYVTGRSDSVYQYTLSTAFDLSTASYDNISFSVVGDTRDVAFNNDGTKMFIITLGLNDEIYQYSLSTAWDISTASYDNISFSVNTQDNSPEGITFNNDGTKLYMVGLGSGSVFQYTTAEIFQPTAQYTPAITNAGGQIDSTYWTDINSMTTDQIVVGPLGQ